MRLMWQSELRWIRVGRVVAAAEDLPAGKHLPRGWSGVQVDERGVELVWSDGKGSELVAGAGLLAGEELSLTGEEPITGAGVSAGAETSLAGADCRLRVAVALDYRDAQEVEVCLRESGERLGSFDIRYAYTFQPFELRLQPEQAQAALREGVHLRRCGGDEPLWIFDGLGGDEERRLFAPHLMVSRRSEVGGGGEVNGGDGRVSRGDVGGESLCEESEASGSEHDLASEDVKADEDQLRRALDCLASLSSLQPFGWLEGCVLDGLYAARSLIGAERADEAIALHLRQYFDEDGHLLYEDLHGRRADGGFTTIEATLPLAVIAKHRPDHPLIRQAVAFWDSRGMNGESAAIVDDDMVTAEGAYTVAYPLATIAVRLGRDDLARQALRQLMIRRDALARDRHVYLRYHQPSGTHTFRSWARAYAWYMLGMTRTWIELADGGYADLPGMREIADEIARVAEAARSWRQPDGLWACFLDEPPTGIDTSGSSGIAAALALGAGRGLLPPICMDEAAASLRVLTQQYVTPDGLLAGVAQHNAGGVELQRGGYRVLSQMGLGLLAQLAAAVRG